MDVVRWEALQFGGVDIEHKHYHDLLKPDESFKYIPNSRQKGQPSNHRRKLQIRRYKMNEKIQVLQAAVGIVDIFFFGFYEYKRMESYITKFPYTKNVPLRIPNRHIAIKHIIQSTIQHLNQSQFKLARLSIMDMKFGCLGKSIIADPLSGICVSEEKVKDYYKRRGPCKISMNDQLDTFYDGCNNNTISDEFAYFFHSKRLTPVELALSLQNYEKFHSKHAILRMNERKNLGKIMQDLISEKTSSEDLNTANIDIYKEISRLQEDKDIFENMEKNEHRLYSGFRATLKITPESAATLQERDLNNLIHFITPLLNISLWRASKRGKNDFKNFGLQCRIAEKIIGLDLT